MESRRFGALDSVELLKKAADKEIEGNLDLESAVKTLLVSTETERRKILANIHKEKSPLEVKPGTAGEFLYGCTYKQRNVNSACTPGCLRGWNSGQTSECDIQTYEYSNKNLIAINNVNSSQTGSVYLFTDTTDIPESVFKIIKTNVKDLNYIVIYSRSENNIDYRFVKEMNVKDLVESTDKKLKIEEVKSLTKDSCNWNNQCSNNMWIWGIIVIIAFLVIMFLFTRRQKMF